MIQTLSYSTLWGSPSVKSTETWRPFKSDEDAKLARDLRYRELRKKGYKATRSSLRGQVRKYWSMGVDCGECCTVYYIEVYGTEGDFLG